MKENLVRALAHNNCFLHYAGKNPTYADTARDKIETLIKNYFPSGSGVDHGCAYNEQLSTQEKIVVNFSFHFLDDHGYYICWKDYKLVITSDKTMQTDFNLNIIGENYRDIKSYLYDLFYDVLNQEIE